MSSSGQSRAKHFTQQKDCCGPKKVLVKKLRIILSVFVYLFLELFLIKGNSKFRIKWLQKTYPAEDAVSFQLECLLRNY